MSACIANSAEADFSAGTWTFEPVGEFSVTAGRFALVLEDEWLSAEACAKASDENRRLFMATCADLGAINQRLGLDPEDGGADPILDAIDSLETQRDELLSALKSVMSAFAYAHGSKSEPEWYATARAAIAKTEAA